MTAHILSTRYETICATNGEEAIEIYKKERPNMILSDLNMPGMSGFELQNTLQDMYCEQIPVMFMTADNSDDTESQGFENGAVDYIRKPFRADVLLKRVENILKNVEKIQGLKRAADIVGRMGGDEFIAFCQYVSEEEVVAEKTKYINEELLKSAKEFMGEDMTIPLGASIGAVAVPDEGTDFLTLYQKADKALYNVKQNGKHGFAIYGEHQQEQRLITIEKIS